MCPTCHAGAADGERLCPECAGELGDEPRRKGTDLAGMILQGKYQLAECVGEGAMGWVYRGTHLGLGSRVAIKIMKPVGGDDTRVARFETEARAASRISHPHVLMIHDFGRTSGGLLYIISEFLSGETLGQLLDREPVLPLGRVVNIFNQTLAAIEEAHSHKLIHRDLKPDNIMVTRLRSGEDFVKVLDFGIARIAEAGAARFTMKGEICGTPAFMSPEQIRGKEASVQSDLYSMCLILFELLTGRPAFPVDSVMEMLAMQLHSQPPSLGEAAPDRELPAALEAVLERGLRKDPAKRFQSVAELRGALFTALGDTEASRVACRGCHLPRPSWSSRCVSCAMPGTKPWYQSSQGTSLEPGFTELAVEGKAGAPDGQLEADLSSTPVLSKGRGDPAKKLGSAVTMPSLVGGRAMSAPSPMAQVAPGAQDDWAEVFSSAPGGRDLALGTVEQFLAGSGACLEILGPSGAGKTSLLGLIADRAAARGLKVHRAVNDPSLARLPFFAVATLVAERMGLHRDGEIVPSLAELRRVALRAGLVVEDLPGLADLFGAATTPGRARNVRLRELRASALRALLGPMSNGKGHCFLFDDADDLDGASLGLLRGLSESLPRGGAHVVLAAESSVLRGDGTHRSLYLEPLSATQVEALVRSAPEGQGLGEEAMSALVAASHGNPLFVREALRLTAAGIPLPDGDLDALMKSRLEQLSGSALEALQVLCLVGHEAPGELLRDVLAPARHLASALEELIRLGFLEKRGGDVWSVTHPRIAVAARDSVSPEASAALHRRIFRVLEAKGASLLRRAWHAREARLGEAAVELLLGAGDLATQRLDDESAALHYRSALLVLRWELLSGEDDARFLQASLKLGEALTGAEHYLAAEVTFKEALASSHKHPILGLRLHRSLARLLDRRGLQEPAVAVLREALRKGLELGASDLLLELYLDLAEVLGSLGRNEQAQAELGEALLVLTMGEGPAAIEVPAGFWRLLLRLAEIDQQAKGAEAAARLAELALAQARRAKDEEGEATCLLAQARLLGQGTERAERERILTEAIAIFQRLGDRRGVAECLLLKARHGANTRKPTAEMALVFASQVGWSEGVAEARLLLTPAA